MSHNAYETTFSDYKVYTRTAATDTHNFNTDLGRPVYNIEIENTGASTLTIKFKKSSSINFSNVDAITVQPGDTKTYSNLAALLAQVASTDTYQLTVY